MNTKIQLINAAFRELRVSGLTAGPSPEYVEIGLEALEDLMRSQRLPIPYIFEDVPDPNTESGIPEEFNKAIQLKLADEAKWTYAKDIDRPKLAAAWSLMLNRLATIPELTPPRGMPMGRGNNRFVYYGDRFPGVEAVNPAAKTIGLNDLVFVEEDFSDYMQAGEALSTVVKTVDAQLSAGAQTITGNTVSFSVTSLGVEGRYKIKLVATGDAGTIRNRYLYFNVVDGIAVGN